MRHALVWLSSPPTGLSLRLLQHPIALVFVHDVAGTYGEENGVGI